MNQCGIEPPYWNYYPALDRQFHSASHIQWQMCMQDSLRGETPPDAASDPNFTTNAFTPVADYSEMITYGFVAFLLVVIVAAIVIHTNRKPTSEATNGMDESGPESGQDGRLRTSDVSDQRPRHLRDQ